jgi:uncharacterized protein (TIGR03067 family)
MNYSSLQGILGLTLLTITSSAGSFVDFQGAGDKDRKPMQGKWEVVSIVSKVGKEEPKPGQILFIVEGGKIINKEGMTITGEATFTLDSSKSPKTIDLKATSGDDKGKIFLGIYELIGPDFKLCLGPPNAARPTEFTAQPNQSLIVMRRWKE